MALIIQPAFPAYRSPLFNKIYNEHRDIEFLEIVHSDLTAIDSDNNEFPIKRADFVRESFFCNLRLIQLLIKQHDVIILFANLNIWQVWLIIFLAKIYGKKLILWTQFREKLKFNIKGLIKFFVFTLCEYLYLYTDLEKQRVPKSMKQKAISLNNGLDISEIAKYRECGIRDTKKFLTIGRFTQKSKMDWLMSCFEKTCYELHVVGVDDQKVGIRGENIYLHGVMTDEEEISKIANSCIGFVYGGDVGLSLIHGMAYGLTPIIHDKMDEHMPEVAAFLELDSGFTFRKGDVKDLVTVLDQVTKCDHTSVSKKCIEIVDCKYNIECMYKKFRIGLEL